MEKLISKAAAAEMLDVSLKTLERIAASGEIPMYRIGGNCKFYERDIVCYIRQRRVRMPVLTDTPKRKKKAAEPVKYVQGMAVI